MPFQLPSVALRNIYVNPAGGNDALNGSSPATALATLSAAWQLVPRGQLQAGQGVRIVIMPGTVRADQSPRYWDGRWGSPSAPIVITSQAYLANPAQGLAAAASSVLPRVNMFNCSHVYFLGLTLREPGEAFHGDRLVRFHMRHVRLIGAGSGYGEVIKMNQCAAVFIEESDSSGPAGNALDFVAVQYGHIIGSRFHDANWCFYLKGGSAYFLVSRNAVYNCGESGLAAGQGTGLQYMLEPWVQYETYDIRIVNNLIMDVWGAGLGVYGALHVTMAHNTLLRVGSRSHSVEFNLGGRGCDYGTSSTRCAYLRTYWDAWGPMTTPDPRVSIPSRGILFLNNIIANPTYNVSKWVHIAVSSPVPSTGGVPGNTTRADEELLVAGNMWWDGGATKPIGITDPPVCPTTLAPGQTPPAGCRVAQLRRDNNFSPPGDVPDFAGATVEVSVALALSGGLQLRAGSPAAAAASAVVVSPLPTHQPWPVPSVPAGTTQAENVTYDFAWRLRSGAVNAPGAWTLSAGGTGPSPSPKPSPKPSPSPSPSPSPKPSPSPSPSPAQSPSPRPSPAPSPSPSPTSRPPPSPSPAASPPPPPWPYPPWPAHFIPDGTPFQLPSVALRNIYVNPAGGNDALNGSSPATALATLSAAWQLVPRGQLQAGQGVRIVIMPGTVRADQSPRYWDGRWGSPSAPIVITSQAYLANPAQGLAAAASSVLPRVNMFNCSHVYFLGLTLREPGEAFHGDRLVRFHMRHVRLIGAGGSSSQQVIKMNQCAAVFIEDSESSGWAGNNLDFVAVQYGHIMGSRFHDANWCFYLKGGSAYFLVSRNAVYNCGESGLAAGQGTGLQYMLEPWVQYETYDIRIMNNLIMDVWGAGLGVYGALHVTMAHNTLLRVGSRSHSVEFNLGGRGCAGDSTATRCAYLRSSAGAWGPATSTEPGVSIPSRGILFLNNIIANPTYNVSKWVHIAVSSPVPSTGGVPGNITRADEELLVAGNMWWDGGATKPIGITDPPVCPTTLAPGQTPPAGCRVAQLRRDNNFSPPGDVPDFAGATVEVSVALALSGGLQLRAGSPAAAAASAVVVSPLPTSQPWPVPNVPAGTAKSENVTYDFAWQLRSAPVNAPGAWGLQAAP